MQFYHGNLLKGFSPLASSRDGKTMAVAQPFNLFGNKYKCLSIRGLLVEVE